MAMFGTVLLSFIHLPGLGSSALEDLTLGLRVVSVRQFSLHRQL